MTEQIPPAGALPSTRTLLRSTAIAASVATALLVTVVLPAEYGVDPTGIGGVLGLTKMGKTKLALEKEAAEAAQRPTVTTAPCTPAPPVSTTAATAKAPPVVKAKAPSDVTRVILNPGEGKEVKLTMRAGARVAFSWATDKGVVNYDLHSDHPTTGAYHGYGKGQGLATHEGVLVAAFEGRHGWFWRNRTDAVLTVTLKTEGDYTEIKELK
jgi:hypothetical protein